MNLHQVIWGWFPDTPSGLSFRLRVATSLWSSSGVTENVENLRRKLETPQTRPPWGPQKKRSCVDESMMIQGINDVMVWISGIKIGNLKLYEIIGVAALTNMH